MYNTNTILNFIFIVFFCYNNNCQSNTIIVKGVIKDSQTLEGLVYASLGLKEHPIGTCSNHDGEFQLIIEDSLINEVIIVKMMGYEQREFIISEMQNKFFEIYLKQSEIQLPEIIALSKQLTAEEILKRVIKNHSKNYPYGFCNYETFFRDLMTDLHKNAKIKNCRLTEAAVNIEDYGLDAFREPKFKIHEIRNSYNYVETSKVSKA